MNYHRKTLLRYFFVLFLLLFLPSGSTFAQSPEDFGRTWQNYPIIPEFSDTAREILKAGIEAGNDPHAFSKVGDCDTSTSWYLSDYDRDQVYYDLGDYEYLRPVLDFYKGSFARLSFTAKPGFSAASALMYTASAEGMMVSKMRRRSFLSDSVSTVYQQIRAL